MDEGGRVDRAKGFLAVRDAEGEGEGPTPTEEAAAAAAIALLYLFADVVGDHKEEGRHKEKEKGRRTGVEELVTVPPTDRERRGAEQEVGRSSFCITRSKHFTSSLSLSLSLFLSFPVLYFPSSDNE